MLKKLVDTTEKHGDAVADLCSSSSRLTWDTETEGLDWNRDKVCSVQVLADNSDTVYYFPFRHKEGVNLPEGLLLDLYDRVLVPEREQVGHNLGFDAKTSKKDGYRLANEGCYHDTLLDAHLLNENEPSFKLENLAERYVAPGADAAEETLLDLLLERFGGSRKRAKGNLHRLSAEDCLDYGCADVWHTRALHRFHQPHLDSWKLREVSEGVANYQRLLVQLEQRGLLLDNEERERLSAEAREKKEETLGELQALCDYEGFNPRSVPQVKALLGTPDTKAETLERLVESKGKNWQKAELVLRFRGWDKVGNTYYDRFPDFSYEGYLYPNLSVTGTYTGRLSCSKPNLQSIPRYNEVYKVKDCFVAPEGYELVEGDYSQAEIRVATHYAQDEAMREVILSGLNMHDVVAKQLGVPRFVAKTMNFSVIYGIGPRTYSKTYNVPFSQAKKFLGKYHDGYPGFRRLYNAADHTASTTGFIRLFTGRVRHFNSVRAPTHKASSNLVQGSVAELMRVTTLRLAREVPEFLPVLQVHDSLLGLVKKGETDKVIPRVREVMEDQPWCSLPLTVDFKRGTRWGQLKEVKQ